MNCAGTVGARGEVDSRPISPGRKVGRWAVLVAVAGLVVLSEAATARGAPRSEKVRSADSGGGKGGANQLPAAKQPAEKK